METLVAKVVGAIVATIILLLAIPKLFGRDARIRRKLRAAQQRAIGQLPESVSVARRVAGMVVAVGEPLIAPLSGRQCVFYETFVVRTIGLGTDWDIEYRVAYEKRSEPFFLDDGTGVALVDATHAQMILGEDVDQWSFESDAEAAAADAFLTRFGQRQHGLLFKKRLHYTERIIEVGERIAVAGTAVHERDRGGAQDGPYCHHAEPTRPRLVGTPRSPLLVTDEPAFAPPFEEDAGGEH